ncbi:MAG TPA: hypothetical protein VIS96_10045, partial [Terrimicrobiaceae bacterium]
RVDDSFPVADSFLMRVPRPSPTIPVVMRVLRWGTHIPQMAFVYSSDNQQLLISALSHEHASCQLLVVMVFEAAPQTTSP